MRVEGHGRCLYLRFTGYKLVFIASIWGFFTGIWQRFFCHQILSKLQSIVSISKMTFMWVLGGGGRGGEERNVRFQGPVPSGS